MEQTSIKTPYLKKVIPMYRENILMLAHILFFDYVFFQTLGSVCPIGSGYSLSTKVVVFPHFLTFQKKNIIFILSRVPRLGFLESLVFLGQGIIFGKG